MYGDREKLAWSIVLATKGLQGFVDELLNSEEYLNNFGEDTVPFQRRRILPQRPEGEVTFEHMARYGTDYRDRLPAPSRIVRYNYAEFKPLEFKTIGVEKGQLICTVLGLLILLAYGLIVF